MKKSLLESTVSEMLSEHVVFYFKVRGSPVVCVWPTWTWYSYVVLPH